MASERAAVPPLVAEAVLLAVAEALEEAQAALHPLPHLPPAACSTILGTSAIPNYFMPSHSSSSA